MPVTTYECDLYREGFITSLCGIARNSNYATVEDCSKKNLYAQAYQRGREDGASAQQQNDGLRLRNRIDEMVRAYKPGEYGPIPDLVSDDQE